MRPSLVLGLVALAFHLGVNGGYGIFRDELYFIVCGRHPAWGYVDQPPLVLLLAAGSYGLFGNFQIGEAALHGKNIALSPMAFFIQQVLLIGPAAAPVWIVAVWACMRRPKFSVFRAFLVAYVLLFAYFVIAHGKAYYVSSIYPTLLAIGSVAFEEQLRGAAARTFALLAVAICGMVLAPFAVPMLPEKTYIAYAAALGFSPSATAAENHRLGPLPQHFADMHGWQEMAEKVAAVYHALPPTDRAKAVFFGHNYGESAAIDVFRRSLGLPPAIGEHNNYWLWGPRGNDGSVVIIIGGERAEYERQFRSVSVEGQIDDPYAMPYETNVPIYVLRGLNEPLAKLWPKIKHYD